MQTVQLDDSPDLLRAMMRGAEDFMVSLESLCDLFRDAFPREIQVTDAAIGLFEPPDAAVLLSREG